MSPLRMHRLGRMLALGLLGGQSAPKNHFMVFVDSENLVSQFQAMKADGKLPLKGDNIFFKPNSYLWTPMQFPPIAQITLAKFYVQFSGGENKRDEIIREIESFPVSNGNQGENRFTPILVEGKKGKAIDLVQQISLDIEQSTAPNPATVCLFSGNGEYLPVLQEAKQQGKQIKIFAFSEGLSPELSNIANDVCSLDNLFFDLNPT